MCNLLPFGSVCISVIAFGLVYCNAVTLITDLICALFGPYAAMILNRIYPGKSLKTTFVSPGKPWNLVFASPGKSWKTVFYCLYEPCFTFLLPAYPGSRGQNPESRKMAVVVNQALMEHSVDRILEKLLTIFSHVVIVFPFALLLQDWLVLRTSCVIYIYRGP